MKPPPPVAIGAKMLGYTIIAFEGICEECGGPVAVAQKPSPRTGKPMTTKGCPVCRRNAKNTYDRQVARGYKATHPDIPYDSESPWEGFSHIEDLWSEEADRKIKEFWATRGMTEEDARKKFRGNYTWSKSLFRGARTAVPLHTRRQQWEE